MARVIPLLFSLITCLSAQEVTWPDWLKIKGDAELYYAADGKRYFSQFLWEEIGSGKHPLILQERYYPADGRPVRTEWAAGSKFKVAGFTVKPFVGYAREGTDYLLTPVVVTASVKGRNVMYIADKKTRLSGQRPSFFYQRAFLTAFHVKKVEVLGRWEGMEKSGKMISSQPGVEARIPIKGPLSVYAAVQYDLVPNRLVTHFGWRF